MHNGLAGNDQSFLEEIDFNHGEGNLKTVKSGMTLFQRFPLYMLNPISVWERAFEIVVLSLLNQTLRVIKLGGAITHIHPFTWKNPWTALSTWTMIS